ncbi:MAG: hypothetical protein E6G36_14165 [Actinobacteria bacterium]|nr:MAG: hypothetical protein E6G36_14165 [Actinomycetota bacterium]
MRARVPEKREVAKGTLLVLWLTMTEDASWNGETRRIAPELLSDHLSDDLRSYAYLVAGPPAMADLIGETLHAAAVPEERISADRFKNVS